MPEFEISAGSTTAKISTIGGELKSVIVPDRYGQMAEVIRGGIPYAGAICGRFANRISDAKFDLDGVSYQLTSNEGSNQLHGGIAGFDQKQWTAHPYRTASLSGITLGLVSPAGDEGYPGELTVAVSYWVNDNNILGIDFKATTTAPTVVNLTNHAYWNLGGPDATDIRTHELLVSASHYLQIDDQLIPTGQLTEVDRTHFDLRSLAPLQDSFDHCFVLNEPGAEVTAAVLNHPASGRRMRIFTDHPGLQVYTANHADHFGVALEAQGFPDAPNHANFPSAVLRPGETYLRTTRHHFGVA